MENRAHGIGIGDVLPFFQFSDSLNQDIKLRFFDNCPTYTKEITNRDDFWDTDSDLYLQANIGSIASKIQTKLNLAQDNNWIQNSTNMLWKAYTIFQKTFIPTNHIYDQAQK